MASQIALSVLIWNLCVPAVQATGSGHGHGGHGGSGGGATSSIKGYTCGTATTSDASSTLVTVNSTLANQLQTAANGTDSAGFTLTVKGTNNAFGTNFLTLDVSAKAGTTSPTIMVTASDNKPYFALVKDGTKVSFPGGTGYSYSNTTFSAPSGLKVVSISVQLDPSTNANTMQIGNLTLNGAAAKQLPKAAVDTVCPVTGP